jgi:hypothetical protein
VDGTLHAVSHKYGKTTIMDSHPAIKGDIYTTSTAKTYKSPATRSKPNWRDRTKGQSFTATKGIAQTSTPRAYSCGIKGVPIKTSGYVMNSTLFDGTGWVTEKNLHSDMRRTEYRNRYNPEKKFHL